MAFDGLGDGAANQSQTDKTAGKCVHMRCLSESISFNKSVLTIASKSLKSKDCKTKAKFINVIEIVYKI